MIKYSDIGAVDYSKEVPYEENNYYEESSDEEDEYYEAIPYDDPFSYKFDGGRKYIALISLITTLSIVCFIFLLGRKNESKN